MLARFLQHGGKGRIPSSMAKRPLVSTSALSQSSSSSLINPIASTTIIRSASILASLSSCQAPHSCLATYNTEREKRIGGRRGGVSYLGGLFATLSLGERSSLTSSTRHMSTRVQTKGDGAAPPPPPPPSPPPSSSSPLDLPPNLILADPNSLEAYRPIPIEHQQRLLERLQGIVPDHQLTLPIQKLLMDEEAAAEKPATATIKLDSRVFGVPVRKDIVHRVVTWQRAKKRVGLASTKRVSEIRGSTKKLRQQKGSGRARAGKKRAPQFRGGYKVHGPRQRDFSFKLNSKVRALGLRIALSAKLREGNLVVVEDLGLPEAKTKILDLACQAHDWDKVLFIDGDEVDPNMKLASRNLPRAKALPQLGANVMDILLVQTLVLSTSAVEALTARLLP